MLAIIRPVFDMKLQSWRVHNWKLEKKHPTIIYETFGIPCDCEIG